MSEDGLGNQEKRGHQKTIRFSKMQRVAVGARPFCSSQKNAENSRHYGHTVVAWPSFLTLICHKATFLKNELGTA
jgi:hypothetical protein